MVFARRRRPARKAARRNNGKGGRNIRRMVMSPQPVFTETWSAGSITTSGSVAAGTLIVQGNSLPQMPDYSKLYRQFRILKCQWILMPRFDSADPNAAEANAAAGTNNTFSGRFVYAINNTAGQSTPGTELEVLTDNGCKIKSTIRKGPIRISHVPVPDLSIGAPSSFFSTYMNKKRTWLNTNALGNNGDGLAVPHGGVSYFLTQPSTSGIQTCFDVYCKTTVQFKDPA